MERKVADRPATLRDVAALGGGGGGLAEPSGVGDDGVVGLLGLPDGGLAPLPGVVLVLGPGAGTVDGGGGGELVLGAGAGTAVGGEGEGEGGGELVLGAGAGAGDEVPVTLMLNF